LKNAVKLYGKENFKREILLIVGNEYANWFETAFIEGYNSVNKNIGYNIAKQASTVRGIHFKHSKKTIEKISKSKLGKTYEEMYGEEVGKKLRKLRADEAIERFTGSKRSEEAKEKMRIKASNRERKKCIYCDKEYTMSSFVQFHGKKCKMNPDRIDTRKECKYCGTKMDYRNINKYHNERCKFKEKNK